MMLDAALLREAQAALATATQTETVMKALSEAVRAARVRTGLEALIGSGAWEGDLAAMREDRPRRRAPRRLAP